MGAKRKWLGAAALLGVALGVVCQMRWMDACEAGRKQGRPATNVTARVVATNADAAAATNHLSAAAGVSPARTPPPPAVLPPPSSDCPRPPRKPIVNDPKVPKARQVLLANRRIAVATGRSFPKKFSATQTPTARGTAPYVVICEAPVGRDMRIQAIANGARVVGFLPNNALLVEADAQALKNLEEDVLFAGAVEYEPTDKLQCALLETEGETVAARIVLLNPQDVAVVRRAVAEIGGKMLDGEPPAEGSLAVTLPRAAVERLAKMAEVKWLETLVRARDEQG